MLMRLSVILLALTSLLKAAAAAAAGTTGDNFTDGHSTAALSDVNQTAINQLNIVTSM